MLQAFANIFRIKELRNKILFTIAMLGVYRIGFWIPVPGVSQEMLKELFSKNATGGTAISRLGEFMSVFSGGSFSHSTIFGLGIMPYISAGIIFQLLASAWEPLKKKQEEGPTGRQQIQEWTRYATVALCIMQGIGWLKYITAQNLVYANWASNPLWWVMAVTAVLPAVGLGRPNLHGVRDLHGLVWEWVEDFNSAMVTGESRADSGLERNLFCGAGAVGAKDTGDYAAFMRQALRSSLKANNTTTSLGFRCARDVSAR